MAWNKWVKFYSGFFIPYRRGVEGHGAPIEKNWWLGPSNPTPRANILELAFFHTKTPQGEVRIGVLYSLSPQKSHQIGPRLESRFFFHLLPADLFECVQLFHVFFGRLLKHDHLSQIKCRNTAKTCFFWTVFHWVHLCPNIFTSRGNVNLYIPSKNRPSSGRTRIGM